MNHQNVVSEPNDSIDILSAGEASSLFMEEVVLLCERVLQRSLPGYEESRLLV